jgi:hypothetical protein
MTKKYLEKKLLGLWCLLWCLLLAWLFLVFSFTPSWDSTEDGGYRTRDKCVRKEGGQETFEWLCTDGKVIYLAQSYTLVVEGQCPVEYQCKYEPGGTEPNIDSVVDSLNDSFKK